MTREDWKRIGELFELAIESSPGDPRAWLEQQSGMDARLKAEVLALLQHKIPDRFLESAPQILEEPPFQPGHVVGPYRIVREAGVGGTGHVYVAVDTRLGRNVALKAMRRGRGLADGGDSLRREAQAAASLTHPGICTVYALEDLDGDVYIASELIEGRTLRQEIAGADRPTNATVVETARSLAAALACAHEAGLVHGDLKPENVMRTYDGRVKILDFGLARMRSALSADEGQAPNRTPSGTPGYMAPERINGQPGDARSDVFALGVLLYEYAAGAHPFKASNPLAMTHRVLNDDPPLVESLRPDLGEPLRAIIARSLRKAPSERFPSATELYGALVDRPAGDPTRARRWWRAHHFVVMGLYGVAIAAAWQVKEWLNVEPRATMAFLVIGVAAAVAAIFRGHLLFTERIHGAAASQERRRVAPATLAMDVLISGALGVDVALMADREPVAAVLIAALALGVLLARLVLEPSTRRAAFPD